jgi:hypothetical protein
MSAPTYPVEAPPRSRPAPAAPNAALQGALIAALVILAFAAGIGATVVYLQRGDKGDQGASGSTKAVAPATSNGPDFPNAEAASGPNYVPPTHAGGAGRAGGGPTTGTGAKSEEWVDPEGSRIASPIAGDGAAPPPLRRPSAPTCDPNDPTCAALKAHLSSLGTDKGTDAISEATKLTPSTNPGEGPAVYGEDGPPAPSDLVQVEEIPADQVNRVLREEGLLPPKDDKKK